MTRAALVTITLALGCAPAEPLDTPPPPDAGAVEYVPVSPAPEPEPAAEPEPVAEPEPAAEPEPDDELPPWERVPLTLEHFDDPGPLSGCLPPARWWPPGTPPPEPRPGGDDPVPPEPGEEEPPPDRPPPPLPAEPWTCFSAFGGVEEDDLDAVVHAFRWTPISLGRVETATFRDIEAVVAYPASPARFVGPVRWHLVEGPADVELPMTGDDGNEQHRPGRVGRYVLGFDVETEDGPRSGRCAVLAEADPGVEVLNESATMRPSDVAFGTLPAVRILARVPFDVLLGDVTASADPPWPLSPGAPPFGGRQQVVWWTPDDRRWQAPVGASSTVRIPIRWSVQPVDSVIEARLTVEDESTAPGPRIEQARMACHQGRPALHVRMAEPWQGIMHVDVSGISVSVYGQRQALDPARRDILIAGLFVDPTASETPLLARARRDELSFWHDPDRGPAVPVELPPE